MKDLKLKSILFSLMAIAMATVFLSSCEKDIIQSNNDLKENKELVAQTNSQSDRFMQELINSTSSEKIKKWLTMNPNNETDSDFALKLFQSFSNEESKEVNEIISKLERHNFDNYVVNELSLSESEKYDAIAEIQEVSKRRKMINETAIDNFGKSIWSLKQDELRNLNIDNNNVSSRMGCTSRQRNFRDSSSMTNLRPYNSNCKEAYDVKVCFGNSTSQCQDDCDWEFRFDGKKSKHRIVYSYNFDYRYILAKALDVGLRVFHGNSLAKRYQYWGGKWHTYLLIGYPDTMDPDNAFTTISRYTLRTYLSMH